MLEETTEQLTHLEERLELGYGLVFLMDWQSKAPAPGSRRPPR
jgi:hypothetical protein